MFGTTHHSAFDHWWEYAAGNYVTWRDGKPVELDLYYDPVVDEHVGRGPMGIMAPTWYFAPQRPEVAQMGWNTAAMVSNALGDGPVTGVEDPRSSTMLLQFSGEFASAEVKQRIWEAAEAHIGPTWDEQAGEFTLGFGLDEPHPRGQWNARAMAGWVCTPGAWSRIFNAPNLQKFTEPTVLGVDFPDVALSEARWDGARLHLAAEPRNAGLSGALTSLRVINLPAGKSWTVSSAEGSRAATVSATGELEVELRADGQPVTIEQG